MEWMEAIGEAINYMEAHITEEFTISDVADHVCISPLYFHKGFSMLCGYSLMEYIRNRRLSLAGVLCAVETDNIIERWLSNGLQNYTKRKFYSFGISP